MAGPLLLIIAVLLAQSGPPDSATSIVEQARSAVAGDSVNAVRARWERSASRDPAALLGLATLHRLTFDTDSAAVLYGHLGAKPGLSRPLRLQAALGLGLAHFSARRMVEADSVLEELVEAASTPPVDAPVASEGLLVLALIRERTQGTDTALVLLERGEALVPPGAPLAARFRCRRARALLRSQGGDVVHLIDEGLRIARAAAAPREEAECLAVTAQRYEQVGALDSARATLERVEALQRVARDEAGLAATTWWRGNVAITMGEYGPAREFLTRSIGLATRVGDRSTEAWAYLLLAHVANRLGDLPATSAYAEVARRALEEQQDLPGLSSILFFQGNAALARGDLAAAGTLYGKAEDLARRIGNLALMPFIQRSLSAIASAEGRFAAAEEHLAAAEELSRTLGQWDGAGEVELRYDHGLLALRRGETGEAIQAFRSYLEDLDYANPSARVGTHARIAAALALQGDLTAAESELAGAHAELDRWRSRTSEREVRSALLQARYFDADPHPGVSPVLARLLDAGRADAVFRLSEERRARDLLDRVARRSALAEGGAGDAPALPSVRPEADVDALRAALPSGTALLSYIVGRGTEPTVVLTVTAGGIAGRVLAPVESAVPDIERFEALLAAGQSGLDPARRLGAALLTPALEALGPEVTRLVVLPDGPLHRLPFEALLLPDGRRVLEAFDVTLAPSAELLLRVRRRPAASGSLLVAFGDPELPLDDPSDPEAGRDLAPLPGARAEARSVARFARAPMLRLGAHASEARLKGLTGGSISVLHLAAHAVVEDGSFLRSALALAPGGGEDGWVRIEELSALSASPDLVVLSACRTLGSTVVDGEGIQGLTTPFLEGGARAVVATRWPVADEALGRVMERFYRGMAGGRPAAEALRQARLELLEEGRPPSEWAALILVGDPDVRPALVPPRGLARRLPGATLLLLTGLAGLVAARRSWGRGARPVVDAREAEHPVASVVPE